MGLTAVFPAAYAASLGWQAVAQSSVETIAIDKSRIAPGWGGTTAWSRVDLGRPVLDPAGAYNAIEAQNLYDCTTGRFTTLRRAYYNGQTLVREEAVVRKRSNAVAAGSIDERLLNEACNVQQAAGVAGVTPVVETRQVASGVAADLAPNLTHDPAKPMRADMSSLSEGATGAAGAMGATGRFMTVADAAPADRTKMIQLPSIDKKAAASAPPAPTAPAARPATPVPYSAAPPAAPAAARPPVPAYTPPPPAYAAPAPKSVAPKPVSRAVEEAAAYENKRTRELILATSGPKKTAKKKESNPAHDMHVHWGYDGEGAPANWGNLKPEYATCANGKRQSPIDIRGGIKVDLAPIRFAYKPTKFTVVDNGHTVQVNVGAGSTIHVLGKRYELAQFHFHKPSEERINGRPFDMVIHFVHKDYDDNLAVIAVLLETGVENPQIQTLWNNMPLEPNQEVSALDVLETAKLIPQDTAHWTYMGSLTTPPCTENVLWMVLKQPMQVSPEQIGIFARLYKNNARPIQPTSGRLVKESR
jgi:carbonic anhydrase